MDAFFSAPAARLGVGYPIEDLERLESIVGPAFAKEMLFTGRRVAAGEARKWGLVNAVLGRVQLESQVRTIAAMIADRPRRNVL